MILGQAVAEVAIQCIMMSWNSSSATEKVTECVDESTHRSARVAGAGRGGAGRGGAGLTSIL